MESVQKESLNCRAKKPSVFKTRNAFIRKLLKSVWWRGTGRAFSTGSQLRRSTEGSFRPDSEANSFSFGYKPTGRSRKTVSLPHQPSFLESISTLRILTHFRLCSRPINCEKRLQSFGQEARRTFTKFQSAPGWRRPVLAGRSGLPVCRVRAGLPDRGLCRRSSRCSGDRWRD